MGGQARIDRMWKGAAGAVVIVVAVAVAVQPHLRQQRRIGEAYLAAKCIVSLAAAANVSVEATTPVRPAERQHLVAEAEQRVNLYMRSDPISSGDVRQHVTRAWLALRVARDIRRLASEGESRPAVAEVPSWPEAVAGFPSAGALVEGAGGAGRFVDAETAAAKLERLASGETSAAAAGLASEFPDLAPSVSGGPGG